MGLLDDILKTIQTSGVPNDPGARPAPMPAPSPGAKGGQGMSPMAKALLALLAVYAAKNLRTAPAPSTQPASPADGTTNAGNRPAGGGLDDLLKGPLGGLLRGGSAAGTGAGGGLGDLLKGPLGGILGGAAAGTILNGGLGDLLKQLQQSGQGDVVHSWVGSGPNKTISHTDIESALGADTLDALAGQSGMQRGELLAGLSQELPRFVDALTPDGRLLSDEDAARLL
jgi:uncharacterized protein YidB (DUF937 family)